MGFQPRVASLVLISILVLGASGAQGAGVGITVAGDASLTDTPTDTLFFPKRLGSSGDRFFRDLEFQLSARYSLGRGDATPGLSLDDINTLRNFGRTLTDSLGKNPFGAPYSDFHLVHNYFSPTSLRYDSDPFSIVGFTLPISDPAYSTADRSHMDHYIYELNQAGQTGGRYTSLFSTPKEDSSTGHWSSPTNFAVLYKNSTMFVGPSRAALNDVSGTGWTRPNRAANWGFIHEFQHALSNGTGPGGGALTEIFSTAAEVISGSLPNEAAAYDFSYTWSLLADTDGGTIGTPRRMGHNYAGWRLLSAYLLFNYRNQDTTATLRTDQALGGFTDDVLYRWSRTTRTLLQLENLLSNDSCFTCARRPSFNPSGQPPLSNYDRLQLLIHQSRVATFVNNAFLDADSSRYGPYGFPPHFGFSPVGDVGAWRDNDPGAVNVTVFPAEVTARPAWVSRDTVISKDRSRDGISYPLVLQPYGSEYWVIRSTSGIASGADLVVRVASDSIYRSSSVSGLWCWPSPDYS